MTSALYTGTVIHQRYKPTRHRLRYKLFWMLFDLDQMPSGRLRFFSRNRFNLVSFHDSDHLNGSPVGGSTGGLRGQIEAAMAAAGLVPDGGPIRLLCMPRVFGHVFNPISVFFCHRRDETLAAMLYEVNNTFGQRHCYLIPVEPGSGKTLRQSCEKAFYVSPFMRMAITYQFRVVPPGRTTAVVINGDDAQGRVIAASFAGLQCKLSNINLLRVVIRHGLLSVNVLAAIHWEAVKLWLKGVPIQPRPAPPSEPVTIVPLQQGLAHE